MAYKRVSADRQWFRGIVCLLIAVLLLILWAIITFGPAASAAGYNEQVDRMTAAADALRQKQELLEHTIALEAEQLDAQVPRNNTEIAQHNTEVEAFFERVGIERAALEGEVAQHIEAQNTLEANRPINLGRLPAILAFPFFLGGVLQCFNALRCLKARSANHLTLEDMGNDPRPPVLYLRPFAVDNAVLSSGARVFNPLNPLTYYKLKRTLVGGYRSFLMLRWTSEQVFEYVTRTLGPMVAIGQPGSPPVMGAYNLFVGEEWKDRVQELAERAQLVVLLAGGTTDGLMWEMSKITMWCDPQRLALFVPGSRYRWWWPLWRVGSRKRRR